MKKVLSILFFFFVTTVSFSQTITDQQTKHKESTNDQLTNLETLIHDYLALKEINKSSQFIDPFQRETSFKKMADLEETIEINTNKLINICIKENNTSYLAKIVLPYSPSLSKIIDDIEPSKGH